LLGVPDEKNDITHNKLDFSGFYKSSPQKGTYMIKKYWHIVFPLLIVALMVFIFCMSAQPADESAMTSGEFTRFIAKMLLSNFTDYSDAMQNKILHGMSFIVRKTAHFTEYACLGFLGYIWLHRIRLGWLYTIGAAVLYAVTDEIHQIFTPGRSCELRDVLVDGSGACFGIVTAFVLLSVLYCLHHREVQRWGTWE
jgi:hypothetical protein